MINILTSLRLFFALMVFGAHCYVIDPYFNAPFFKEGFVGVSFFFVLSGFIIAYNYQDKIVESSISKKKFWVARVARVYPLHLLTLFVTTLIAAFTTAPGVIDWLKHTLPAIPLLQPFIPDASYFFVYDSPSWSLGCEQMFYFLFPFLALYFSRGKRLGYALLLCAILVPVGMYFTPEEHIKAVWYVNPISRLPDFLVGMAIYPLFLKCRGLKLNYSTASLLEAGSVLFFLLFYLFAGDLVPKVYRYSCYYWLPIALLLLIFSLQKGFLSRLLSNKYLIIGGEISFSFYLIHLLVLSGYRSLSQSFHWQVGWPVSIAIIFCITTGLSLLSYYYFEKPANKWVKAHLLKGPSEPPSA